MNARTVTIIGTAPCAMGTWHLMRVERHVVEAQLLKNNTRTIIQFIWPNPNDPFFPPQRVDLLSFSQAVIFLVSRIPIQPPIPKVLPLLESLLMDAVAPLLMERDRNKDGVWKAFEFSHCFEILGCGQTTD